MFVDTLIVVQSKRILGAYQQQQLVDKTGGFVLPCESVVSNFTFAQELLIVLREISKFIGDALYKNEADAAATFALIRLMMGKAHI